MPKNKSDPAEPRAIERLIRSKYDDLPGSERALADRVLEYPNEVLLYSATELAERAGASKAAVSRFVKRLGYGDFRDMQREIRHAQMTGDPIFLSAKPKKGQSNLSQHLERDMATLRETIEQIDSTMITEVAQKILSARRVVCLGFRNSYIFANYLRRQLILVRKDVALVPGAGQMVMEDIGDLGPDDLLIAIGLRRRASQLAPAMELFRDRGVPIAYFTDRRAVRTRDYATWVFPCQVRGTSLFDSYVGVMSLLNFVATHTYHAAGRDGRMRLSEIEAMLDALGELDPGT
ncbi:MurR/RpiR family transcriptional regulator [Roseovarius indicus]|uniref:Putative HTH-type transcriptional regulator YbbH n=1 Tax=Roseovarius indicus TaxID=540747 RepID=A0A5P3AM73_9RHOB|nr:MurR/RpiR family transcriptional regulator [Roseovarius indicus]QEW29790.1 putative HTH-type transcriptional regulator YbbH [Roseovarius indicus]SFE74898.1 transcriptional regulator, RpiR family [Roseovarius indicus]